MLENYNRAIALIEQNLNNSDLVYTKFTPVTGEIISDIQKIVKNKFPYTYINFLKKFGHLSFGSEEIFGVYGEDLTKSHMLKWTLEARNKWHMPSNLVIIHELGDGTRDCLQINENDPDKSPVVEYHDPESPVRVIAPDFGTFLLELVEQEIKFAEEERKLQENA